MISVCTLKASINSPSSFEISNTRFPGYQERAFDDKRHESLDSPRIEKICSKLLKVGYCLLRTLVSVVCQLSCLINSALTSNQELRLLDTLSLLASEILMEFCDSPISFGVEGPS